MEAFALNAAANAAGSLAADGFEEWMRYVLTPSSSSDTAGYEGLQREAELLRSLRDDTKELRTKKKKISSRYYNNWLSRVNDILRKVETLNALSPEDRVQETIDEVIGLLEHGKFQGGFWVDVPSEPKPVVKMNPPDIKLYRTLQSPLEELLQYLSDDRVKVIGVHGLPGVGKTTIMQNLNDHEEVSKMFQIVIWVTVSKESPEVTLQTSIASRLNLNAALLDHHAVAESISEKLKGTKFLLLLDDAVNEINLSSIGIHDSASNKGSKVVVTTRNRDVCKGMDADRMIKVEPLSPKEAWPMFLEIAKDQIVRLDVAGIAQNIAKKCNGFPTLIKTVANHFKRKGSVQEWRSGLERMRTKWRVEIPDLDDTYSILKFCCDSLEDEKKKLCFLYGALHPADMIISTDYLIKCWAAERFMGDIDQGGTFRSACDEGYAILQELIDLSLLQEEDRWSEYVQVNNMLREVAFHMSKNMSDCTFLTGEAELLDALQVVKALEKSKRVFAVDTRTCSRLVSLLFQRDSASSEKTSPGLFAAMKKLHVLNLRETGMDMLPASFGLLVELKALFLRNCASLTTLPLQIRYLCLLEVLDIRRCEVIFIPHFIGKLKNLRSLKVSYYKPSTSMECEEELKRNCEVISGFPILEELVIDVMSFDHWRKEAAIVIQRVASLEKLTSLEIHFPKLENLITLLEREPKWKERDSEQLLNFWFSIGRKDDARLEIQDYLDLKVYRYLRFCPDGADRDKTASDVFPETDALELIGYNNITCLSEFMEAPSLHKIRGCLLQGCNNMKTIVDGGNSTTMLQSSQQSLSKLYAVVVKSCPALTKISSSSLIHKLSALKKLVVQDCSAINELIENSGDGTMENLEVLELYDLPNLATIVGASFSWPRLNKLLVFGCPMLKKLPFNKENAAELKRIEGEKVWWDGLEWEDDEVEAHFQSIFKVRV